METIWNSAQLKIKWNELFFSLYNIFVVYKMKQNIGGVLMPKRNNRITSSLLQPNRTQFHYRFLSLRGAMVLSFQEKAWFTTIGVQEEFQIAD